MKAAVICPVPELHRMVGSTRIHLLLPKLFEPPHTPIYEDFYRFRRQAGEHLILDNGAYDTDGGTAIAMPRLLGMAAEVHAQEVVLPDAPRDAAETMRQMEKALTYLTSDRGRMLYQAAGRPALMVVPHGHDLTKWAACLQWQLEFVQTTMKQVHGPPPTIGVSKVYGGEGVRERVGLLDLEAHPVHLLGWAGGFDDLAITAEQFPELRSVDSARPITYAKHGRSLDDLGQHVSRDFDFFEDAVMGQYHDRAGLNIQTFRELVDDQW